MKRCLCLLLSLCLMLPFLAGCAPKVEQEPSYSLNTPVSADYKEQIESIMKNMSTEQKVGQLFMFSLDGTTLGEKEKQLLSSTHCGNIILYTKNITDGEQLTSYTTALQDTIQKNTKIPAFVGIDQEGGKVTRIYKDATVFPGAMATAAAGNPDDAYTLAKYMGEELRAYGIHMNFAPVIDVNSNSENPVINSRAYSDDPEKVAVYSQKMFQGLQDANVLACGKHFPGHGDTNEDSHYSLPTVEKTLEELKKMELIPFQNAINNGLDGIMTSHILFPNIDDENLPATLSKNILTGVLRNDMGFSGLIITDSMSMTAIDQNYGTPDACVKAINAGANLLVLGSGSETEDYSQALECYQTVLKACKNGTITTQRLDDCVTRILAYKIKYGLYDNAYPTGTENVNWSSHQELATQVSQKSITVAKDKDGLLPLEGKNTLVVSPRAGMSLDGQTAIESDENSFAYQLATRLGCDYKVIDAIPSASESKALAESTTNYDTIVIACTAAQSSESQRNAIQQVIDANDNTIVVSLASPYDVSAFRNLSTFVCAYEYTPLSTAALVQVLSGSVTATGKLPVDIKVP